MFHSDRRAVWVCGPAAVGKSTLAAASIVPLGFELLDVDVHTDRLEAEYAERLAAEPAAEDVGRLAGSRTRRRAQRLALRVATRGWIDPEELVEVLESEWEERAFDEEEVRRLVAEVRRSFGAGPVMAPAFLQKIWPKMERLEEPEDYLAGRSPLTRHQLLAVARECLRRQTARARAHGRNLLFVETGGLAGRLLRLRQELLEDGYRTLLVWVFIEDPRAVLLRNARRARSLPDAAVTASFAVARRVRPRLEAAFSPDFIAVDNTSDGAGPLRRVMAATHREVRSWLERPAGAPAGPPRR